jgi:hypothetical protein
MDGVSTIAIGRFAWGSPGGGPWFQALASAQSYSIRNQPLTVIDSIEGPGGGGPGGSLDAPDTLEVSNDTTQSRPQLVLTGGLTRGPVHLSALGRFRRWQGETSLSPALRVGYERGALALSVLGERSPLDSIQRIEANAYVSLLGRYALSGVVSQFSSIEGSDAPSTIAIRGEAGVRSSRMWYSVGALQRDAAFLPAAVAFDSSFLSAAVGESRGLFVTARGKFYRDVGVDITATKYKSAGIYRPQYETRSRLYVDSDMRSRFPSGNLNILFAITHDYRTQALFPTADAFLESSQYRVWSAELEIRLLTATISFQYRNFFGEEYQQVPGFKMPSITSVYGVRWSFIN